MVYTERCVASLLAGLYPPKGAAVDAVAMVSTVTSRKSTVITVASRFMWLINESTSAPVTAS